MTHHKSKHDFEHFYSHDHDHNVEPVEIYHHEEEEKPRRRWPWVIASIFMMLLMLSFVVPMDRLGSIVESKDISGNHVISLSDNSNILFNDFIYEDLRVKYIDSTEEFKVCLMGKVSAGTYVVRDYYYPKIYQSSFANVVSAGCNSSTIISMHSHPSGMCIFSKQDIVTFKQLREYDENVLIGLMCGTTKFNFYGYE